MTVSTRVINLIMQREDLVYIQLKDGLKLQVLPNIAFLPTCQKYQNAAFIKDQAILIVWADSPKEVLAQAAAIEEQMMHVFSQGMSPYGEGMDEKKEEHDVNVVEVNAEDGYSKEEGYVEKPRKIILTQAILTAITLILIIAAMASGWRKMAIEIAVDNSYTRLALLVVTPLQIWLALVSCLSSAMHNRSNTNTNGCHVVFYASRRRLCFPALRSNKSNGVEFQILFWGAAAPTCER